jgi:hypothetical protein
MLHAYFRPAGQVNCGSNTGNRTCPAPGVSRDGASLDAQPAGTQALFGGVQGTAVAGRWALEHNIEPTRAGR